VKTLPDRFANRFGLEFHHLGLAVSAPAEATQLLAPLGYNRWLAFYDPLQRVNVGMWLHQAMPDIELIWPGEDLPSPIDNLLARRHASFYHLGFVTKNRADSLDAMARDGVDIVEVSSPKPAVLFGGATVSFHEIPVFGLIELIEVSTSIEESNAEAVDTTETT